MGVLLNELIDKRRLKEKSLIPGEEYLLVNEQVMGIYLGGTRSMVWFALTYDAKNSPVSKTNIFNPPSWQRRTIEGQDVLNAFASYYIKWKDKITNFKSLGIICVSHPSRHNDALYLRIGTGYLDDSPMVKPILTGTVKKALESIKKDAPGRTSYDYKISSLLLGKLPDDLCEVNETGLITVVSHDKSAFIYTLSRAKIVKALNKWYKMDYVARSTVQHNFWNVLCPNFEVTKIGRLVKRFTGRLFSDTAIEAFVSTFQARLVDFSSYKLEVVKGRDIIKLYNLSSYTREGHGSLQNSCMRYSSCSNQIAFYAHHSNCELLIMTLAGKLYARALIWTLADGSKYLDRIYYTFANDRALMKKWAIDNGIKDGYDAERERGNITDSHGESSRTNTLLVPTNFDELLKIEGVAIPYTDTFVQMSRDGKHLIRLRSGCRVASGNDLHYYKYGHIDITRNIDLVEWWKRWVASNIIKPGDVRYRLPNGGFSVTLEDKCVWSKQYNGYVRIEDVEPDPDKPGDWIYKRVVITATACTMTLTGTANTTTW